MEKYSVVLLKECKIENYVSEDDHREKIDGGG